MSKGEITPLLYCKRPVLGHSQTHHLGLSVEAIEVYVRHHPEWTGGVV
jgi:hypothetical protein